MQHATLPISKSKKRHVTLKPSAVGASGQRRPQKPGVRKCALCQRLLVDGDHNTCQTWKKALQQHLPHSGRQRESIFRLAKGEIARLRALGASQDNIVAALCQGPLHWPSALRSAAEPHPSPAATTRAHKKRRLCNQNVDRSALEGDAQTHTQHAADAHGDSTTMGAQIKTGGQGPFEMVGQTLYDYYLLQTSDPRRFQQRGVWAKGNCGFMALAWTLMSQAERVKCTQMALHTQGMELRKELAGWWLTHASRCDHYLACLHSSADPNYTDSISAQIDTDTAMIALASGSPPVKSRKDPCARATRGSALGNAESKRIYGDWAPRRQV